MTISKTLATATKGKDTITAYESYDKFSRIPRYEIVISRDAIALDVIKTAKTTWKKRFRELTK